MSDSNRSVADSKKVFEARTTEEIIEVMKEQDAAEERKKILDRMSPACREKLEYIEGWLRRVAAQSLKGRYELGLVVKELYDDEQKNGGKLYGKNAIGRICKLLNWGEDVIRGSLRLVQGFTPEEVEQMCNLLLPSGEALSWSHVRTILAVEDSKRRRELLDKTAEEGWTCSELARVVKNETDPSERDGRGRPPRTPKDFDGAVAQQQQSAEQWDRLHSRVWATADKSLIAQAAKLSGDEVTNERLHQARDLAQQLRKVADQAVRQAEQAEQVVREFEEILRDRKQKKSGPKRVVVKATVEK